jgi:hypothetical protein
VNRLRTLFASLDDYALSLLVLLVIVSGTWHACGAP